jgi:hypothetical protein
MTIRKLRITKAMAAERTFRTLPEVDQFLDGIKEKLSDLDELTKSFQNQFARVEKAISKDPQLASPFSFKVDFQGDGSDDSKKKMNIKTGKFDKVVIPKPEILRKNFDVVVELYDQYETLQNVYNSVATNLRGVSGSVNTLKNIKAMMQSAKSKIDKALKFLETVGQKYSPEPFKKLVESTMDLVEQGLDFQSYENFLYATETPHKELQFTHYVKLQGLMDNDGGQFPVFYVVFTCILKPEGDKVQPEFYVTVMHEFQAPGTFNPGRQLSDSKSGQVAVFTLFHLENVSNSLGTVPHNIDPAKLTKDKFSVAQAIKGVEATPDSILFVLLKNTPKKAIPEIAGILYNELKAKIQGRMKNVRLKAKVTKTEAGYSAIQFTLVNLAENDEVSVHDLDYLKEVLKVDDAKMRQIVRILNT